MSRLPALCVSAPTEMKSTPVSATRRMVASVMPPEASVSAFPSINATASRIVSGVMLSSMMMSAPAASASRTMSSDSVSTSIRVVIGAPARARRTASAIDPAISMWLSLIMMASARP
ncbi:hypothetical protein D3C86_1098360 [compost metagenome]